MVKYLQFVGKVTTNRQYMRLIARDVIDSKIHESTKF